MEKETENVCHLLSFILQSYHLVDLHLTDLRRCYTAAWRLNGSIGHFTNCTSNCSSNSYTSEAAAFEAFTPDMNPALILAQSAQVDSLVYCAWLHKYRGWSNLRITYNVMQCKTAALQQLPTTATFSSLSCLIVLENTLNEWNKSISTVHISGKYAKKKHFYSSSLL